MSKFKVIMKYTVIKTCYVDAKDKGEAHDASLEVFSKDEANYHETGETIEIEHI